MQTVRSISLIWLSINLIVWCAVAAQKDVTHRNVFESTEDSVSEMEFELLPSHIQEWLKSVEKLPTISEHINAYASFVSQLKVDQFSLTGIPFLTEIPSLVLDVIDARLIQFSKNEWLRNEYKQIKRTRNKISNLQKILYTKKFPLSTRIKHWIVHHKRKLQGIGAACLCLLAWYWWHKRLLRIEEQIIEKERAEEKRKIEEQRVAQIRKEQEFTALMQGRYGLSRFQLKSMSDPAVWEKHHQLRTNIIKRSAAMPVPHPWKQLSIGGLLDMQKASQEWIHESSQKGKYSITILSDAQFVVDYGQDKSLYHVNEPDKAVIPFSIAQRYSCFVHQKDFVHKQGHDETRFTVDLPSSLKDPQAYTLFLELLTAIVDKSTIAFEEEEVDDEGIEKFLKSEEIEDISTLKIRVENIRACRKNFAQIKQADSGLDEEDVEIEVGTKKQNKKEEFFCSFLTRQAQAIERSQNFLKLLEQNNDVALSEFQSIYTKNFPLYFGRKRQVLENVCIPFLRRNIKHDHLMQVIRTACQSGLCEMYPFLAWLYVRLGGNAQDSALQAICSHDFINEVHKHYFYIHGVTFDQTSKITITLTDLIDYDMFSKPRKPFSFVINIEKVKEKNFDIVAFLDVSTRDQDSIAINFDGLRTLLDRLLITTVFIKGKLLENSSFIFESEKQLKNQYLIPPLSTAEEIIFLLDKYRNPIKNVFLYDESKQENRVFKCPLVVDVYHINSTIKSFEPSILKGRYQELSLRLPSLEKFSPESFSKVSKNLRVLHLHLSSKIYPTLPLHILEKTKKLTELFMHIDSPDNILHAERAKIVEHIKKIVYQLAKTLIPTERRSLRLASFILVITPYGEFKITQQGERIKTDDSGTFDIRYRDNVVLPYGKVVITPEEAYVITPSGKVPLNREDITQVV